jgi:AcrR family transcriptional regulator
MGKRTPKRKYELKRRAERRDQTRQRIVDAAIHLHQTVGGEGATISAIAAQAGVERLTVYRHFPDMRSLLAACTSHYLSLNPPPDPADWQPMSDPELGLSTALAEIYAYHRQTEAMMNSAVNDMATMPVLRELMAPMFAYWNGVRDFLADRFPADWAERGLLRAAIGHAIDFITWRSLVRQHGLDDAAAVRIMLAMINGLRRA